MSSAPKLGIWQCLYMQQCWWRINMHCVLEFCVLFWDRRLT